MPLVPAFEVGVWNAWILMSSFILQMLAVLLLGREVWARSSLPSGIKRSKLEKITPIIGNSVWFLATIYSIFLPLWLGTLWFYIGLPIFLVGLVILTVATAKMAWPMHFLRFLTHILPYRIILAIVSRAKYYKPSQHTIDSNMSRAMQVPKDVAYKCLTEINKYDVRDMLSKIDVTTLIIIGEKDKLNLKGSQHLSREIKGSKLQIMADTGHTVMIENLNEFNQLVQQFIAEK